MPADSKSRRLGYTLSDWVSLGLIAFLALVAIFGNSLNKYGRPQTGTEIHTSRQ